ncbi:aminomethyltransferase beta-barrel domain-containing protein, partial [Peptoniphilus sp. oral taxon 386]
KFPLKCTGKIRYRAKDENMTVYLENDELKVIFENPLKGVTPGQVLVFYQGDICLGSGIIK